MTIARSNAYFCQLCIKQSISLLWSSSHSSCKADASVTSVLGWGLRAATHLPEAFKTCSMGLKSSVLPLHALNCLVLKIVSNNMNSVWSIVIALYREILLYCIDIKAHISTENIISIDTRIHISMWKDMGVWMSTQREIISNTDTAYFYESFLRMFNGW